MCDASMLIDYGIIGAFDTVCNQRGEDFAIYTGIYNENSECDITSITSNLDNEENSISSNRSLEETLIGLSFLDLQFASEQLAGINL